jgi:hypothetical protein
MSNLIEYDLTDPETFWLAICSKGKPSKKLFMKMFPKIIEDSCDCENDSTTRT